MLKTNEAYNIELNANCFIIPNALIEVNDFCGSAKQDLIDVANANNLDPDQEKYVEIWYVIEGTNDYNHSANLVCSGINVQLSDANNSFYGIPCRAYANIGRLPVSLFEGKHEGDTIDVIVPGRIKEDGKWVDNVKVNFKLHLTLTQQKYRYRGKKFEILLNSLSAAM